MIPRCHSIGSQATGCKVVCLEDGLPGLVRSKLGSGFKDFSCSPLPGEMMKFDDHIFQMG